MGIDVTSSTSTTTTISTSNVRSSSQTQKISSESFKDEMGKVESKKSENENIETKTQSEKNDKQSLKKDDKVQNNKKGKDSSDVQSKNNLPSGQDDLSKAGNIALNELSLISVNNANSLLQGDIIQMMNSNMVSKLSWGLSIGDISLSNNLSMNETDAQFFINLTQNENISVSNIMAQAQNMVDNGAEAQQVQKSAQVSQALLDALNSAREKNQPVRVDFDQNVAVILRVNQNGQIAAHFIPGDKAVEQYLRNNIESLKNTFDENNLPYSDLSYSHSSKEQNQRRRNQQQGE